MIQKIWIPLFQANIYYVRFLAKNRKNLLIILLPGGPGISGNYMNNIARTMSEKTDIESIVIDLPNHGLSKGFGSNLIYKDLVEILRFTIKNFSNKKIILIGHSFGAQLALDLSKKNKSIDQLILLNFSISKKFNLKIKNKIEREMPKEKLVTEKNFIKYWKNLMPYYFSKFNRKYQKILLSQTCWDKTKLQNRNQPNFKNYKKSDFRKIKKLAIFCKMDLFYVGNESEVFSNLGFKTIVIPKNGHFPMLENKKYLLKCLSDWNKMNKRFG